MADDKTATSDMPQTRAPGAWGRLNPVNTGLVASKELIESNITIGRTLANTNSSMQVPVQSVSGSHGILSRSIDEKGNYVYKWTDTSYVVLIQHLCELLHRFLLDCVVSAHLFSTNIVKYHVNMDFELYICISYDLQGKQKHTHFVVAFSFLFHFGRLRISIYF